MQINGHPTREQLLEHINQVSFAVNELTLFLDTHPECQEARAYFEEKSALRKEALEEYARLYGPLTIDAANDSCSQSWQWIHQPWPWEPIRKGGLRACGITKKDFSIQ